MSLKIFTLKSAWKSPGSIFLLLGLLIASLNAHGESFNATFENPPPPTEDTCTYTLELFDSFGDGWNGSVLTISVNGISTDYTFTTGTEAFFTVEVPTNAEFIATYTAGAFQNEVTYNILDGSGNVIFSDGPFPQTGIVLNIVGCPSCPAPFNLKVDNVGGVDADISWTPADSSGIFLIEYGTSGFALGSGNMMTTSNSNVTLTGLSENTAYDFLCFDSL